MAAACTLQLSRKLISVNVDPSSESRKHWLDTFQANTRSPAFVLDNTGVAPLVPELGIGIGPSTEYASGKSHTASSFPPLPPAICTVIVTGVLLSFVLDKKDAPPAKEPLDEKSSLPL